MTDNQIVYSESAKDELYTLIFSHDAQKNTATEWFEWIALSRIDSDIADVRKRVNYKNFEGDSFSSMLMFFNTHETDREQVAITYSKKGDKEEKVVVKRFGVFESALAFMKNFRHVYRFYTLYTYDQHPIVDAIIGIIKNPVDTSMAKRCYSFVERLGGIHEFTPNLCFITRDILTEVEYPKSDNFSKK